MTTRPNVIFNVIYRRRTLPITLMQPLSRAPFLRSFPTVHQGVRHKTGRKVGRPSTERRLVKSQPKFRAGAKQEDSEDSPADTVDFETACQVVMYDTLLMWKDPPPPSTKLIEGPKEDSFSQVMNDTLLFWKTPHSPHRHLRIEGAQGRSYESDSCSSARYSHIFRVRANSLMLLPRVRANPPVETHWNNFKNRRNSNKNLSQSEP